MEQKILFTIVCISIFLMYIIVQLCAFFDVGEDVYGFYLAFYVFIILSLIVLPNDYLKLNGEIAT